MEIKQNQDSDYIFISQKGNNLKLSSKCTHRGGLLKYGTISEKILICPMHGACFSLSDGKNIAGPKCPDLYLKNLNQKIKT